MSDEDELDALQALVRERMEHLQHDLNLFIGLRAGPGTKERKGLIKKKKKLPSPAEWDRAHWGLILQAAESLFPGVFAAASPRTDAAAGSARGRAGSGSPTVARGKSANPEANAAVGQFEKKFSGWALVDGFRIIVEQLQNLKRDLQQLQQQHVHNRRRQSGDAGTDGLAAEDKPWVPTPPWNQLILGMIGQAAENIFLDSGDEMTSSQRQQQTTPQRKEQAQIQSPRTGQSSDSTAASSPSTSTTRRVTSEEATSPPTRSKGDETLSWSPTLARRASVAHEDHQNVAFSGVLHKYREEFGIHKWLPRYFVIRDSKLVQIGTKIRKKDLLSSQATSSARKRSQGDDANNPRPSTPPNSAKKISTQRSFKSSSGKKAKAPMAIRQFFALQNQELHERVVCDLKLCHVKRRARAQNSRHNLFSKKKKKTPHSATRSSGGSTGGGGLRKECVDRKKVYIKTMGSYADMDDVAIDGVEDIDADSVGSRSVSASPRTRHSKSPSGSVDKESTDGGDTHDEALLEGTDFEIWSAVSQEPAIFRCIDVEECNAWVKALEDAIGQSLNAVSPNGVQDAAAVAEAFATLEGFGTPRAASASSSGTASGGSATDTSFASTGAMTTELQTLFDEVLSDLRHTGVQGIISRNPTCADCGAPKVEWASINLGVVLCIECSGGHRNLGSHISKVRSLFLDRSVWSAPQLALLTAIGNEMFNAHWECNAGPGVKPMPSASLDAKTEYVTRKYLERRYVASTRFRAHRLTLLGAAEADLAEIDRDDDSTPATPKVVEFVPAASFEELRTSVANRDIDAVVRLLGTHGPELIFDALHGLGLYLKSATLSAETPKDALAAVALRHFFSLYGPVTR